jgi:methionine synthase II (cobalamin-independent)
MFDTTIAGSLPKPTWLAEPNRLWAPWRLTMFARMSRYSQAARGIRSPRRIWATAQNGM